MLLAPLAVALFVSRGSPSSFAIDIDTASLCVLRPAESTTIDVCTGIDVKAKSALLRDDMLLFAERADEHGHMLLIVAEASTADADLADVALAFTNSFPLARAGTPATMNSSIDGAPMVVVSLDTETPWRGGTLRQLVQTYAIATNAGTYVVATMADDDHELDVHDRVERALKTVSLMRPHPEPEKDHVLGVLAAFAAVLGAISVVAWIALRRRMLGRRARELKALDRAMRSRL